MEPAPITARAEAIKVATIRQKMSRVRPILLLLGFLEVFFEREGVAFFTALAVLVLVFGLAVDNLEAPE